MQLVVAVAALEAEHRLQFNFSIGRPARERPTRQSNRFPERVGTQISHRIRRVHAVENVARIDTQGQIVAPVGCRAHAPASRTSTGPSASTAAAGTAPAAAHATERAAAGTGACICRLRFLWSEADAFCQAQIEREVSGPG